MNPCDARWPSPVILEPSIRGSGHDIEMLAGLRRDKNR